MWNVYNVFLKCQDQPFYNELKGLKLVKVNGHEFSYDSTNLLRAELVSSSNVVLQFVSINNNSLQNIDEQLLAPIRFILEKKLTGVSLVIFGWSDSCKQTQALISKLVNPPSRVISIEGTFEAKKLCDFLCALHENLHLGMEDAIGAGVISGVGIQQKRMPENDRVTTISAVTMQSADASSGAIQSATMNISEEPPNSDDNRDSSGRVIFFFVIVAVAVLAVAYQVLTSEIRDC